MKKKILSVCLVAIMAITAITGASLAYLTDTDEAANVFVMGNVKVELLERQRNDEGTALEAFENDKVLIPLVGSAQGDEVTVGDRALPDLKTARNWVDKIVDVTNTGASNAYVRVVFAFPADMDDAVSASKMMLHWNYDGNEPDGTWTRVDNSAAVEIDGRTYNLYTYTYNAVLAPETTTAYAAITGVYLDSHVDATVSEDGSSVTYTWGEKSATYPINEGPEIHVFAQAVQSDGFDNAEAAFEASFGTITAENNPWVSAE